MGNLIFFKKLTLTSSSSENVVAETVRKLINVINSQDSSLQTGRTQQIIGDDDTFQMATVLYITRPNSMNLPQTGQQQLKEDKELDGTILLHGMQ